MKKKTAKIKKVIALITTLVFLIANPALPQAGAWQQPKPPGTYLDPNEINDNNPNPLAEAISRVGASPLEKVVSGLPQRPPDQNGSVDTAQGKLNLSYTDLQIPSAGFPLTFRRVYSSGNTRTGPFGTGWDFTYNRSLTMYSGYAMMENRGDQGSRTYNYTKNDPSLHVTSYDGSNRVQYPLENGYYTPAQAWDTSQLTRNPDVTYTVREKDGTTYKYTATKRAGLQTRTPLTGRSPKYPT